MLEDAYLAHLCARLTPESSRSYLAYIRRVERVLQIDVDTLDLSASVIDSLSHRLRGTGLPEKSVSNCRSALAAYSAFKSRADLTERNLKGASSPALPKRGSEAPEHLPDIDTLSIPQLMQLYARVLSSLRDRKVTRTANGPIGDYAEMLFHQTFGWRLEPNSNAGYDAQDITGTRYQIKARRLLTPAASRQLGALRRLPECDFDILAVILFNVDVSVIRAVLIPHAIVVEHATRVEHTNSWRLILSDKLCLHGAIVDVTRSIAATASV